MPIRKEIDHLAPGEFGLAVRLQCTHQCSETPRLRQVVRVECHDIFRFYSGNRTVPCNRRAEPCTVCLDAYLRMFADRLRHCGRRLAINLDLPPPGGLALWQKLSERLGKAGGVGREDWRQDAHHVPAGRWSVGSVPPARIEPPWARHWAFASYNQSGGPIVAPHALAAFVVWPPPRKHAPARSQRRAHRDVNWTSLRCATVERVADGVPAKPRRSDFSCDDLQGGDQAAR